MTEKAGMAFTKRQFMQAANFTSIEKDMLQGLLHEDETYTHEQVKIKISEFEKRKVQ